MNICRSWLFPLHSASAASMSIPQHGSEEAFHICQTRTLSKHHHCLPTLLCNTKVDTHKHRKR